MREFDLSDVSPVVPYKRDSKTPPSIPVRALRTKEQSK